jgi:BlaI family transcriptional regulator, penicillinase repressor
MSRSNYDTCSRDYASRPAHLRPYYTRRRLNLAYSWSAGTVPSTKLSKLELNIMEALWTRGACSIREIHEAFPKRGRPAYTTVQTMVYRLEGKQMVRRAKKISNAHIFEAVISRDAAHRRLVDDLLGLFGGQAQSVMAHLVESGKLTLDDIKAAEKTLRETTRKDRS